MKKTVLFSLVSLVGGLALGWFLRPAPAAPEVSAPAPRAARAKPTPAAPDALARLRARVADLKRQLAAARAQPDTPAAEPVDAPRPPDAGTPRSERRGPPSSADMRAHLEEIRRTDPERYTHMTNNFARWRARQQSRAQNQMSLLAEVDTASMTKSQRATHTRYQELIQRQHDLRELIAADIPDAERDAAFHELHTIGREMHNLAHTERDTLLTQTANALGYTGDDAREIVESIKAVYQATESHGFGGPHGRGRGAPPPPPPAP